MIENIKSMFSKMNDETRSKALNLLKTEFNVATQKEIKNKWIIGGRIPNEHQEHIVVIFQQLLNLQYQKLRDITVHF
jgi:hypothetical protein